MAQRPGCDRTSKEKGDPTIASPDPLGGGRPPRQCVPVDASVTGAFAVWEPRERCLGKHQELDALGPGTLDVLEVLVQIRLGRAEASVDLGDPDA